MRRLSTNAALRALRASRGSNLSRVPAANAAFSGSRDVRLRPLCSNAPIVIKSKSAVDDHPSDISPSVDPITSSISQKIPVESSQSSAPEASVSPDSQVAAVVTESAPSEDADSSQPEAQPEEEEFSLQNDIHSDRPTYRPKRFHNEQVSDLTQFASPREFMEYLKDEIEARPLSAMLMFRTALEQEDSPLVNVKTVNLVLPTMARSGWYQTVKDTLAICDQRDIRLTTVMYNCALYAMTRTGDLAAMKNVLYQMSALGANSRPNVTSYNLVIAAHFYQGTVDDAFAVLQDMKSQNIYPSIATYQTLVSGCLRRRDFDRAYTSLVAIEQQGMAVSAMTVAQMLYYAIQGDRFDHITYLLNKLEDILPSYGEYIERIATRRSGYSRRHPLVHESERGEPKLEISLLTAMLHAAYRGGRPDIALRAWELIKQSYPGLDFTSDHWYSLIGSIAAVGDFESAFDAVGHMKAAGIQPEIRDLMNPLIRPLAKDISKIDEIYYYLVEGIEGKHGDDPSMASKAEIPFDDDQQPGTIVDGPDHEAQESPEKQETTSIDAELENATAANLVENLEPVTEAGDVKEHISLSEAIGVGNHVSDGYKMGRYTLPWTDSPRADVTMTELNCIITACSLAGDIDRAFETYDEACGRLGMTRDGETLLGLLEGCVQTRHIRGGIRVLEEARTDGTLFTTDTLLVATRLYCRAGRGVEALALLKEGMEIEANISVRTWQILARSLIKSGAYEEAEECVQLGVKCGYRENALTPLGALRGPDGQKRNLRNYDNAPPDLRMQDSEVGGAESVEMESNAVVEGVEMEGDAHEQSAEGKNSTDDATTGEEVISADNTKAKMDS